MKRINLSILTTSLCYVVAALFTIFAVYMFSSESNDVYKQRADAHFTFVEQVSEENLVDASYPAGISKRYSFALDDTVCDDDNLIFYSIHQFIEVRFNDELVYSIKNKPTNIVGHSPSSNWIVIPLYPSDIGSEVEVTAIPANKSVINKDIEFLIGSKYDLVLKLMRNELLQLILSLISVLIGIILIGLKIFSKLKKKVSKRELLYLGLCAILLGTWRISDSLVFCLFFSEYSMALGYMTLETLFVLIIPLMLFMAERHEGKKNDILKSFIVLTCIFDLIAIVCQIFGIIELRELLFLCHVMLCLDIAILSFVSLFRCKDKIIEKKDVLFTVLLVCGSVADFALYYLKNTSAGMMFTLIAFLSYAGNHLVKNIVELNQKIYIDEKTGLFNKTYWEEFIMNVVFKNEDIGIMMIDLNGLKIINDSLGHYTGDMIIINFANILQNNLHTTGFVCRWGGDEFTVLIRHATKAKLQNYDYLIHEAVKEYNDLGHVPKINFACGYAISSEFPDLSMRELFSKADELMYIDKQRWYNDRKNNL